MKRKLQVVGHHPDLSHVNIFIFIPVESSEVDKTCSAFGTQQTFEILHFVLFLGYSD